mgnify:FL=1|jgi:hypothetical protein
MYNLILNKLPKSTPNKLKIRTDFRESIKFELLMQDNTIKDSDKVIIALKLYYYKPSEITNIKTAVDDMLWFYRCGKDIKIKENNDIDKQVEKKQKQIYSYEFDAEYIYSAFMEQYKIDLNSIQYLHWWKFKALFTSLNENVLFSKIMEFRTIKLSKIKDKSMKEYYSKMKKLYALPDMRSEEEKEEDFANALW